MEDDDEAYQEMQLINTRFTTRKQEKLMITEEEKEWTHVEERWTRKGINIGRENIEEATKQIIRRQKRRHFFVLEICLPNQDNADYQSIADMLDNIPSLLDQNDNQALSKEIE